MDKKWNTKSVFVDVDTGELLKVTNERQLKYLNYRIINKTKKFTENEKFKNIEFTNECRYTGQRRINFE